MLQRANRAKDNDYDPCRAPVERFLLRDLQPRHGSMEVDMITMIQPTNARIFPGQVALEAHGTLCTLPHACQSALSRDAESHNRCKQTGD